MNETDATGAANPTEQQTAELSGLIDALLTELPDPEASISNLGGEGVVAATSREEALAERRQIVTVLAAKLADPADGETVASYLADRHNSTDGQPQRALYVYWGLAQRIAADHTEKAIPKGFLELLQTLADEEGDTDILFALMAIRSLTDSDPASMAALLKAEVDSQKSRLQQADEIAQNELITLCVSHKEGLSEAHEATLKDLLHLPGDEYAGELQLISEAVDDPDRLLDLIAKKQIKSDAGIVAAKVLQDRHRFMLRAHDYEGLMQDIISGKFVSEHGVEAAKAQHDSLRLKDRADNLSELLQDILHDKFVTPQGIAAARTQYDLLRLAMRAGNPAGLQQDIFSGKFRTIEGFRAAKAQCEYERLIPYGDTSPQFPQDTE